MNPEETFKLPITKEDFLEVWEERAENTINQIILYCRHLERKNFRHIFV